MDLSPTTNADTERLAKANTKSQSQKMKAAAQPTCGRTQSSSQLNSLNSNQVEFCKGLKRNNHAPHASATKTKSKWELITNQKLHLHSRNTQVANAPKHDCLKRRIWPTAHANYYAWPEWLCREKFVHFLFSLRFSHKHAE